MALMVAKTRAYFVISLIGLSLSNNWYSRFSSRALLRGFNKHVLQFVLEQLLFIYYSV